MTRKARKTAVSRHYRNGLTLSEIAKRVSVPLKTIRQWLRSTGDLL